MDTQKLTITEALDGFGRGSFTPQDLTAACFNQINRLNPTLNAYITIIEPKNALEAQLERRVATDQFPRARCPGR